MGKKAKYEINCQSFSANNRYIASTILLINNSRYNQSSVEKEDQDIYDGNSSMVRPKTVTKGSRPRSTYL